MSVAVATIADAQAASEANKPPDPTPPPQQGAVGVKGQPAAVIPSGLTMKLLTAKERLELAWRYMNQAAEITHAYHLAIREVQQNPAQEKPACTKRDQKIRACEAEANKLRLMVQQDNAARDQRGLGCLRRLRPLPDAKELQQTPYQILLDEFSGECSAHHEELFNAPMS